MTKDLGSFWNSSILDKHTQTNPLKAHLFQMGNQPAVVMWVCHPWMSAGN